MKTPLAAIAQLLSMLGKRIAPEDTHSSKKTSDPQKTVGDDAELAPPSASISDSATSAGPEPGTEEGHEHGNERGTMKEGEAVKPKGGKQICEASPTNPDPESQSDEQWDDNAPYCTRGEHHAGLHSWEVAKPEAPPVDNGTRN
jgi:hypothetical protein